MNRALAIAGRPRVSTVRPGHDVPDEPRGVPDEPGVIADELGTVGPGHHVPDQLRGVPDEARGIPDEPRAASDEQYCAFDPHVHTLFSHCSISQPERLIREAVRIGLSAIGVMDHNDVKGALDAVRCCEYLKSSGAIPQSFLVVPGIEVNSTAGHIGALFVEKDLPMGLEPAQAVDAIHDAGGLAVAVHPYHSTGIGDAVFDAPFDAVEVECGSVFDLRLVARNRELAADARLSDVAKIGSSDAHYVRAMASCYTVAKLDGPPTLDALRRAIVAGACEPRTSRPYERLSAVLGSIRKLR